METSYSIIQRESEYRILLAPADTSVLSEGILDVLTERNIDVSELMIERISGESTTDQGYFFFDEKRVDRVFLAFFYEYLCLRREILKIFFVRFVRFLSQMGHSS